MKGKLFKKAGKQVVALFMSLTMIFTMLPLTAIAASSTEEVGNAFGDAAKGFGINKIYSTGLLAVGEMLTSVAAATDNENFQSVASFINVWVCGGNNTSQSLVEIEALCEEILSGVKTIDEKLDTYTGILLSEISKEQLENLQSSMNAAWDNDVENLYPQYMSTALGHFKSYISTVNDYMNGVEIYDANVEYDEDNETFEQYQQRVIDAKRMYVFTDFCNMHGGISINSEKKDREDILFAYDDNVVDTIFKNTINNLRIQLEDTNYNYGDECAKFAYNVFPDLSDQHDYVISNINKHFMEIAMVEMLYQEYLSMRGEYLQTYYADDTKMWDEYKLVEFGDANKGVLGLDDLNGEVITAMENYLDSEFSLEIIGKTIRIDQYPTKEDLNGVKLQNTNYYSKFTNYQEEAPIKDYDAYGFDDYSTSANVTSEYMSFNKIPMYTSNGIEIYYLIDGNQSTLSTLNLVAKNEYVGNDVYLPTCDFYNLTKGVYSDGANTFTCPSLPKWEAALFNTGSYSFYSSIPYNYLNIKNYYNPDTNSEDDDWTKNIYQIFSNYDYHQDGAFTDCRPFFSVLNMNDVCITTNLETAAVDMLDGRNDIVEAEEFDKTAPYYTAILQKNNSKLENTISTYVKNLDEEIYSGSNNDIYIKRADGTIVENGTKVSCGEKLTLYLNEPTGYVLNSLKIYRYNDMQNPNVPTSEKEILSQSDFDSLKIDEETGCYILDITMPYSNCEIVLDTLKGYKVYIENETKQTIKIDGDRDVFDEGENVYFRCDGKAGTVSIHYGDNYSESKYVKMTYDDNTGRSLGSFQMPDSDVLLKMEADNFDVDEGTFLIRTYEDLCEMSDCVNSGGQKYTEGNYVLLNDITIPDDAEWIPINNFNGTFEGNDYSISNLHNAADVESFGLFGYVKEDAVIQNLNLTDIDFKIITDSVSLGGLCVDNNGKISNCSTAGEIVIEPADTQSSISVSIGGICKANNGEIVDSHSDCNIIWKNKSFEAFMKSLLYAGGICAMNLGTISRCYNTGDITFTGGPAMIGGLVGYNKSMPKLECYADITDCYNTGNINIDFDISNVDIDAVNAYIDGYNTSEEYDVNNASELIELINKEFDKPIMFSVGGLVGVDEDSKFKNCYNYGEVYSFIVGYDEICHRIDSTNIENCYYAVSDDAEITDSAMKYKRQFASGEVTYLLNSNVVDGTQIWYQNLDNGLTPDSYPVLKNNGKNTVYKVDLSDKIYSNIDSNSEPSTEPATEPSTEPSPYESVLETKDLKVYHRIFNTNGTVNGTKSVTTYGRGVVDNDTKTITIKTLSSVERIGIYKYQGKDPVKGTITLDGYESADVTSKDILDNNMDEPDIYVDNNGCIFIKVGSDTSELTLEYKQYDKGSISYSSVKYKVVIEVVEASEFTSLGYVSSERHYELGDVQDNETPTDVADSEKPSGSAGKESPSGTVGNTNISSAVDEAKPKNDTIVSPIGVVKTGSVVNLMIPAVLLISAFVILFVYKLKKPE